MVTLLSRDNWANNLFYLQAVESPAVGRVRASGDCLLSRDNWTNIIFYLQAAENPVVGWGGG